MYVDGQVVGGVTEATLKDRRTLAAEGVVTVLAIVDADTGALTDPPDFLVRGFEHAPGDFKPGRRRSSRRRWPGRPPRGSGTPTKSSR